MKALILIGGFGTRLRPLSCTRPKALFPIVNKPLLQRTFEKLVENDVDEAVLAVNRQTEFYLKQHRVPKNGLKIKYSQDPPNNPLGTAGPVKKAEKLLGNNEPFLVLNGDIFADIDYKGLIESHKEGKAVATIALHEVQDPSRYGVAETAEDNRVARFIEKPSKESAPSNLINAGVYVISPKIFSYIPEGKHVSMEREIFPRLAEEKKLYGYKTHGLWIDIGKPDEYLMANKILLDNIKVRIRKNKNCCLKSPVALDKGVEIGENSVIGPYVVLGKNVKVGKNVQIEGSVVLPDATVGDCTTIHEALIGEAAIIGSKVKIESGCIIGDQAKIKDNLTLTEGISVCPGKEASGNILKSKIIC